MTLIKKIPVKALLIFAIGMVIAFPLGAKYGHKISWITTEKTLLATGVAEKVNEPTVSNDIKNEIKIDKIKKSDSIKIILDPVNNQKPTNIIASKEIDSCVSLSELSSREIKRLKRRNVIR